MSISYSDKLKANHIEIETPINGWVRNPRQPRDDRNLIMKDLADIIELCHKRHAERDILRQRKTVVTPALYKQPPFHIKVHCARGNALPLDQLENADISFMPIGHASENDEAPLDSDRVRHGERQKARSWRMRQWYDSWGIHIHTGIPSARDSAYWHDFDFKYEVICAAPDDVAACIDTLLIMHANPLLTLTKSGGLRFSCRIPDYLHSNTDEERFFIYKRQSTDDETEHLEVYLEVVGDAGYSQWDMRYEILRGNLLAPPVIEKEVLFTPIEKFRDALHEPESSTACFSKKLTVNIPSFGSVNLEYAKAALLKRGFSYVREDEGSQHWKFIGESGTVTDVALWEDQGIVRVRASTSDTEIPTHAVVLTEIWDDTGILHAEPVSDTVLSIRAGSLSPLAIKRPPPTLDKQSLSPKQYQSVNEQSVHLKEALNLDTRILALTTSDAGILNNTDAETHLLNSYRTCLNIASREFADAAAVRYATKDLSSMVRWRSIFYRWDEAKDVPIEMRMENPFQHGNMCEDPERYRAIMGKGGNPREVICPKCPVFTACQERGYLSQLPAMRNAHAQISPVGELFLNPRHTDLVQQLGNTDVPQRICIIDERKTIINDLFLECVLQKKVLEQWIDNWKGHALGNFARALMHSLETQSEQFRNPIGQIRTAVEAFEQRADEIVEQMCYINVHGKVVEHKTVDPEKGGVLSNFAINFQNGVTAYIPLDVKAEDRLYALGQPVLSLDDFSTNADISIPMQITEAAKLGFLDFRTVESIESMPTVCRNPDWTYWHQLKRFFTHYKRDADAPMQWGEKELTFWLPPMLHPNVKRLLIISPFLTEQHFRNVFPDEEINVVHVESSVWLPGNKVFQIRASSKTQNEVINLNKHTNGIRLSKIGERYLCGIRADIERDTSIKHAIFTNNEIARKLSDLAELPNVHFIWSFKSLLEKQIDLDPVQVLWVVGTPRWNRRDIWQQAQMLFGNDEKPLIYDDELWTEQYKDERIQAVYDQNVSGVLTQIVGSFGMHRNSGKTVMLLNNFELPDITNRPETQLFDWEDFEIAGGLDKLEETIRIRERFEAERDNLTANSSRKEVERILGCSSRQANRVLKKLRGGNIPRVSYREQILFLLASGRERTTASLVAAIDSSPQAIGNELKRLLDAGEIVRVRRGLYSLPEDKR